MEIRRISNYRDEKQLNRLMYSAVHNISDSLYTQEQKEVWAPVEMLDDDEYLSLEQTYVAVVEDSIVGFIDVQETGYINMLFVLPDWQRKGVASALLEYVEKRVLTLRVATSYTHASLAARTFFEKHGFSMTSEEEVERRGVLLTRYVMKKRYLG